MKQQQDGMILIAALVMLLPLTLIAMITMQSSGQDLKMAGASASLNRAEYQLDGVLQNAVQQNGLPARISTMTGNETLTISGNGLTTTADLQLRAETLCKRRVSASSQNALPACRYVEIEATVAYGKTARNMSLTAGLEQPLLSAQ